MLWKEIYINREVSHEEILAALRAFFKRENCQIIISENDEWVDTHDDNTHIVCNISHIQGDFPLCLWIAPFPAKFNPYIPISLEAVGTL